MEVTVQAIIEMADHIEDELEKLCEVSGANITCFFSHDAKRKKPTGWVDIGDYELEDIKARELRYMPDYKTEIWGRKIDADRISSFTEPPKENSPDTDQSNQGLSDLQIAHSHITPKEEDGQG